MYGNELMGGVVGIVGWDNFSPAARGVGRIFTDLLSTAEIMPTTSIAVYDDGNVLEVVNVKVDSWRGSVQVLNGRVVDVRQRMTDTGWESTGLDFLTFLSFTGTQFGEINATIDFYNRIESSAESDEREDERDLLREMMDDTERYPDLPEGVWMRMAELGS
jgi:hypothetical protein